MRAVACGCVAGVLAVSLSAAALVQEPKSASLAKQLAAALDAAKIDSIAAKDPSAPDVFIGALYFPGVQLLVVSAKYTVPTLLIDKLTKKVTAGVTTGQIYWGAVPFVLIQIIMIGLVIAIPQMVMVYKAKESTVDPTKIQIQLQPTETPQQGPAPTEQQEQQKENESSQSLENLFKTPTEKK